MSGHEQEAGRGAAGLQGRPGGRDGPRRRRKLDPARPLRCFVSGQFVGEITLAECARKNGVATGALDVGVDETGALAAADEAGALLTPLPPPEPVSTPPAGPRRSWPRAPSTPAGATPTASGAACPTR
jgi:hypothetical protein